MDGMRCGKQCRITESHRGIADTSAIAERLKEGNDADTRNASGGSPNEAQARSESGVAAAAGRRIRTGAGTKDEARERHTPAGSRREPGAHLT